MKKLLLILMIAFAPSSLMASDAALGRPSWSFEMKAGLLVPDIDNWSNVYGDRDTAQYGGAVSYKIIRQVEVGIGGAYSRAGGSGFAPVHQSAAGHVTLEFYPIDVFVLARGIFNEDQWLVPYAGGGWSRVYYREEIQDQSVSRGFANGFHARGGLQFLIDGIDASAANSFYRDFGVRHTYLFIETKYTRAMADTSSGTTVNIGGTSWLGGFLFEF